MDEIKKKLKLIGKKTFQLNSLSSHCLKLNLVKVTLT
jgi:hypothetical protein